MDKLRSFGGPDIFVDEERVCADNRATLFHRIIVRVSIKIDKHTVTDDDV